MSGPASIWNKVAWSLRRSAAGWEETLSVVPTTTRRLAFNFDEAMESKPSQNVDADSRYISARRYDYDEAGGEMYETTEFTDGSTIRFRFADRIAEGRIMTSHQELAKRRYN